MSVTFDLIARLLVKLQKNVLCQKGSKLNRLSDGMFRFCGFYHKVPINSYLVLAQDAGFNTKTLSGLSRLNYYVNSDHFWGEHTTTY